MPGKKNTVRCRRRNNLIASASKAVSCSGRLEFESECARPQDRTNSFRRLLRGQGQCGEEQYRR